MQISHGIKPTRWLIKFNLTIVNVRVNRVHFLLKHLNISLIFLDPTLIFSSNFFLQSIFWPISRFNSLRSGLKLFFFMILIHFIHWIFGGFHIFLKFWVLVELIMKSIAMHCILSAFQLVFMHFSRLCA